MFNKIFENLTINDILEIVDKEIPEGREVDYKGKLELGSDSKNKEFLFDVTSFANASGGFLIIGVRERKGIPVSVVGYDLENVDAELQRIESLIQNGVSPRITGIKIKAIPYESDRFVIILKIPNSWNSPHQVTLKGTDKFYSRNNSGKYKLDVFELRQAFDRFGKIEEKVRNFKTGRISKVVSDETPIRLREDGKIILHLVPLDSMNVNFSIELSRIKDNYSLLDNLYSNSSVCKYNFDGYIAYSPAYDQGLHNGYLQIFRNGVLEYVDSRMLMKYNDDYNIPSVKYEQRLISVFKKAIEIFRILDVSAPIVLTLAFLNVKDGFP